MIKKIISGGQTGVDRGGLDWAMSNQVACGGFCPKGRKAEDGTIPSNYENFIETKSAKYPPRTRKNICVSDATLIINEGKLSGGTRLTYNICKKHEKPVFCLDLEIFDGNNAVIKKDFSKWLAARGISVLNIAGPRETKRPGIQKQTSEILSLLFAS